MPVRFLQQKEEASQKRVAGLMRKGRIANASMVRNIPIQKKRARIDIALNDLSRFLIYRFRSAETEKIFSQRAVLRKYAFFTFNPIWRIHFSGSKGSALFSCSGRNLKKM